MNAACHCALMRPFRAAFSAVIDARTALRSPTRPAHSRACVCPMELRPAGRAAAVGLRSGAYDSARPSKLFAMEKRTRARAAGHLQSTDSISANSSSMLEKNCADRPRDATAAPGARALCNGR